MTTDKVVFRIDKTITKEITDLIKQLKKKHDYRYSSKSHFYRCATIRLLKDEQHKKSLPRIKEQKDQRHTESM